MAWRDVEEAVSRKFERREPAGLLAASLGVVPMRYADLLSRYRIEGTGIDVDKWCILMSSVPEMNEAAVDFIPGCCVRELGWIAIGEDATGGGDPFFINVKGADSDEYDPEVIQIFHDSVWQGMTELVDRSFWTTSLSLSALFARALRHQ
jgi:hypothetical protein